MKLKNAGIKSVDELAKRLVAGEIFYTSSKAKLIYNPEDINVDDESSPFQFIRQNGKSEPMGAVWNSFANLFVEDRWEDNIGKGVACWVSHNNKNPDYTYQMRIITCYDKNNSKQYISSNGTYWRYAIPVGEEIEKFLLKNR